jgi:hypothetical protein
VSVTLGSQEALLFVTKETYQGDMTPSVGASNGKGLSGADANCRLAAKNAGLRQDDGTVWAAVLTSKISDNAVTYRQRFAFASAVPIRNLQGDVLFTSSENFLSDSAPVAVSPFLYYQDGTAASGRADVWTGRNSADNQCNGAWIVNSNSGAAVGDSSGSASWLAGNNGNPIGCANARSIYCIGLPPGTPVPPVN